MPAGSILLINIETNVKNEPNMTFMTLAMTFRVVQSNPSLHSYCHHPGEASYHNREKVTEEQILIKWTISVKIGEKWKI